MNQSNVFGLHSVFYYYGVEHLALNLSRYIQEGLENNELIYISMPEDLYEKITSGVNGNQGAIRFKSAKELILTYKMRGLNGLRILIDQLIRDAAAEGYTGVRFIGQSDFAMQETSAEDFTLWESGLTEALEHRHFSLMCIYDMKDLLAKNSGNTQELVKHSLQDHPYIFYQLQVKDIHTIGA